MGRILNSNHSSQMNKKQNELNLYDLGHAYAKLLCEEADQLEEEYKYLPEPQNLDRWFKNYYKELTYEVKVCKRKEIIRRYLSRAAMLLLVLLVSVATVTMSVDAFRVKFLNLFVEEKNDHNVIKFEEVQNIEWPSDWNDFYYPTFIPDGYVLDETQRNNNMKTMIFTNNSEKILIINQSTDDVTMNLDSEKANNRKILINESEAVMVEKDKTISITWSSNETIFLVTGEEDIRIMIQIAEKIKKYE